MWRSFIDGRWKGIDTGLWGRGFGKGTQVLERDNGLAAGFLTFPSLSWDFLYVLSYILMGGIGVWMGSKRHDTREGVLSSHYRHQTPRTPSPVMTISRFSYFTRSPRNGRGSHSRRELGDTCTTPLFSCFRSNVWLSFFFFPFGSGSFCDYPGMKERGGMEKGRLVCVVFLCVGLGGCLPS